MARLLEYQGKQLLKTLGIRIPDGQAVGSIQEAYDVINDIHFPVVIKAQILRGGRGKAGGVKFAKTKKEANRAIVSMINAEILGQKVSSLLIEKKLEIKKEYYCAVTSEPSSRYPIIIFSTRGGINIEDIARDTPDDVYTKKIDIYSGLQDFEARWFLSKIKTLSGPELVLLGDLQVKLYQVYRKFDCRLVEINPLVLTSEGLFAADARVEIDDDALYRQRELPLDSVDEAGDRPPTKLEIAAGTIDRDDHRGTAHYVQLDPFGYYCKEMNLIPIGFNCVGTGASLITLDELVPLGFYPINFADTSGNPTASKQYRITKIIFSQPLIKGFLFVSCISNQQLDNTARGVIKALRDLYPETDGKPNIPVVLAIRGAWDLDAIRLFKDCGITEGKWIRILGRESTEQDAALAFYELYQQWAKKNEVIGI